MKHISQLPFVLSLLEDDSPIVQEQVVGELKAFGRDLPDLIQRQGIELSPAQEARVDRILRDLFLAELYDRWAVLAGWPDQPEKLEAGLSLLSYYLSGRDTGGEIREGLDALAAEFRDRGRPANILELTRFLFRRKRFRGNQKDYYSVDNSDLTMVLERRLGNPSSLAMVLILVGWRLDIPVFGCNYPGHFLALAPAQKTDGLVLIDCFNSGYILGEKEIARLFAGSQKRASRIGRERLLTKASETETLVRFVSNIRHGLRLRGRRDLGQEIARLPELLRAKSAI